MGINANIFIKATIFPPRLHHLTPTNFFEFIPREDSEFSELWHDEATHEVETPWRYYGPGYERGHWPTICALLLDLLASPDIETVWYDGDHYGDDEAEECTLERITALSAHYIATEPDFLRGQK